MQEARSEIDIIALDVCKIAILGHHNVGITSCCFSMAHELARQGKTVVFVCKKTKIEASFPSLVRTLDLKKIVLGGDLDFEAMSRIHFNYINTGSGLRRLMASMHAYQPQPDAIVIDSFDSLFEGLSDPSRASGSAISPIDEFLTTVAFVEDAVLALNSIRAALPAEVNASSKYPIKLILNCHSFEYATVNALARVFDHVLVYKDLVPAGGEESIPVRAIHTWTGHPLDCSAWIH